MANKVIVTKSKLNTIGDTIREKTGEDGTYTLDEMPGAIRSINGNGNESGGRGGFYLIGSAERLNSGTEGLDLDMSKIDTTNKHQFIMIIYTPYEPNAGSYLPDPIRIENPKMLCFPLSPGVNSAMWQESGSPNIQVSLTDGKLYNYLGDSDIMYNVKVFLFSD